MPTSEDLAEWARQGREIKKQQEAALKALFAPKLQREYEENGVKVKVYEPVKSETPQYVRPTGKMRTYALEAT